VREVGGRLEGILTNGVADLELLRAGPPELVVDLVYDRNHHPCPHPAATAAAAAT
jgi:hypothetical protein